MNPLRITATNYRTFPDLDVQIPTGTVAIVGENGAGKSSILNAIDVALFAERGELPELLTAGEDSLELQLEFEHAGELYRVRRQLRRGKSPTLDLERATGVTGGYSNFVDAAGTIVEFESLSLANAQATQERINEILGLSRTTFRASSFLRQGDGAAFTEAQPRDRKAMLAEILGLAMWDQLLVFARNELRTCEHGLTAAKASIADADALVARKGDVAEQVAQVTAGLAAANEAVTTAEADLEEAQRAHSAAAVLNEAVKTYEAEHRAAVAAHDDVKAKFAEAEQAAHTLADRIVELAEVSRDAGTVDALEQRLTVIREGLEKQRSSQALKDLIVAEADQRELARERMGAQSGQLTEQAETVRAAAVKLETAIEHAGTCDRCAQTLGAEAAAKAAESYRKEAAELDRRATEIDDANVAETDKIQELRRHAEAVEFPLPVEDPQPVEDLLRAARLAAERRASLGEQVTQLTEKSERKPALEEQLRAAAALVDEKDKQLAEARSKTQNLDELTTKVERWRLAANEGRRLVEQRTGELTRLQVDLERIVEAETLVAARRTEIAQLQRQVDVLKLAEIAYGRDGIPALIVENAAIPQLEKEANQLLSMMPTVDGVTFTVELHTQREKKDGGLKDTLDIVIFDGQFQMPYECYSGGEKTRLNICLRIALARLLANRRGAESRLLAIDEIPYLDETGQQQLVDVVQSVAGDFDRVLMVSHSPNIRDAFDTTIRATKSDRRSTIADTLQAVAA